MTGGPTPAVPSTKARFLGTILLVGAGQMGGALLDAWLLAGLEPRHLSVVDPRPSDRLAARLREEGISLNEAPVVGQVPDIAVLAIKPQMLAASAPTLAPCLSDRTLLISVLAGKTIEDLRRSFPTVGAIARAMPNTPVAVQQGITGVALERRVTSQQRAAVETLLAAAGQVEWLAEEALIDAVTAMSGSGPAYVFYMTECLAKAGEAAGLEPGAAMRLARATVQGAGALMTARANDAPDQLRRNVTSPGGTTAAALDVLMRDPGLPALMTEAVLAAQRRAGELAG